MSCHCGKEQKALLCGTLNSSGATSQKIDLNNLLSCKQACNKMLSCGMHKCEQVCHTGECSPCQIIRSKTCYCGQQTQDLPCGSELYTDCARTCHSADQARSAWTGEFSCDAPCPWLYDCEIHKEAEISSRLCHPHTSPSPLACPRSVDLVTTCACGQTSLIELSMAPRQSCSDPIPSCGKICSKPLSGCDHRCTNICHEGQCAECTETVTVVCRCGSDKKTMPCFEYQKAGSSEFECDKICRALRACGRHECGRKVRFLTFLDRNTDSYDSAVRSHSKKQTRSSVVSPLQCCKSKIL